MSKKELKEHFLKMLHNGEIDNVVNDARFQKIAEPFLYYPNALKDVLKNRKHSTIVFLAISHILK